MDDFEQRLAKQTLSTAPDDWRAEILSKARGVEMAEAGSMSRTEHNDSSLLLLIRGWLWPHPGAWAGLVAIWLLLFAMQYQMNLEVQEELVLAGIEPPVTDVMVALEEHQMVIEQLLAMNNFELPVMDRPKRVPQSPTNFPPLMLFSSGISWENECQVEVGGVLLDVAVNRQVCPT